jgi:hypothetical protein
MKPETDNRDGARCRALFAISGALTDLPAPCDAMA